jgi:hypothetical protein
MSQCAALTVSGAPCRKQSMLDSSYCWTHDPSFDEERRRAGKRGGLRGGRGRPQLEVSRIKAHILALADAVLSDGDDAVDRGAATCVNQLYTTYLRAVSLDLKIEEQLELRQRLDALEEALHTPPEGPSWRA